ncbi:hypothetical protein [Salibacterium sp. K-3]
MLIAGYGKLTKMILSLHQGEKHFHIFNRTSWKVEQASASDPRIRFCPPSSFSGHHHILLALPPEAVIPFLREYRTYFAPRSIFYLMSTSLYAETVQHTLPDFRIVPLKFPGHAVQAEKEKNGALFVMPEEYRKEREFVRKWLGPFIQVAEGTEEMVERANKTAVEETMNMIDALEERLEQQNVSPEVQKAVFAGIPAGVTDAHLKGAHGSFAKQIWRELQQKKGENMDESG